MMSRINLFFFIFAAVPFFLLAEATAPYVKPPPTRPSSEAEVIMEWVEILDECFEETICVQGHLYNQGRRPAKNVKLKVEIGGTKYSAPRMVLIRKLDQSEMNPGDRQDFDLTINRKIPYEEKGKQKILEVGKFNFKIVPTWSKPVPTKPARKSSKSKVSSNKPTKKPSK